MVFWQNVHFSEISIRHVITKNIISFRQFCGILFDSFVVTEVCNECKKELNSVTAFWRKTGSVHYQVRQETGLKEEIRYH